MKNILILAPHPDDECVGLSKLIKQKRKKGCIFYIFFLTNGVIAQENMWFWEKKKYKDILNKRLEEMKNSVSFLGIKNHYLQDISTRCLKDRISDTLSKIEKILVNKNIDTLFVPAYEGGHQDHDVANFIAFQFKNKLTIYEFSEYNNYDNKIRSNKFIKDYGKEVILKLNDNDKKFKKDALNIYDSEKSNLNYIDLEQETYRPIVNYDYKKPAHKGTLFYKRFSFFSWHPKVDSDKPINICKKLIEYSKTYVDKS